VPRFFAAILLAAVLPVAAPLHGQTPPPTEQTCSVHGRIADPLGAAISRAFVLVHSKRVNADQQVALSENGEFDLSLKPGLYAFFVD
jgi:hypothetical protein